MKKYILLTLTVLFASALLIGCELLQTSSTVPARFKAGRQSSDHIELSWSRYATEDDYYIIQRSLSPIGPWDIIKVANAGTYVDKDVLPDTAYYYRIAAADTGGYKSSRWSQVSTGMAIESYKYDYLIGDTGPAGGLIFYIDTDDHYAWTYLESAPSNIQHEGRFGSRWGLLGLKVNTETVIGSGITNTETILATFQDWVEQYPATGGAGGDKPHDAIVDGKVMKVPSHIIKPKYMDDWDEGDDYIWMTPAAVGVREYSANGYDDWFMPSIDELELLYTNLHLLGKGNFVFNDDWGSYLSSSLADSFFMQNQIVHSINFFKEYSQAKGKCCKRSSQYIRPVRAF